MARIIIEIIILLIGFIAMSLQASGQFKVTTDLRNRAALNGTHAITDGNSGFMDGHSGTYVFNDTLSVDDGYTYLRTTALPVGGWVKLKTNINSTSDLIDTMNTRLRTAALTSTFIAGVLGFTPANATAVPTNNNQLTNGSGYITGITSSMINTALGFTPYSNANPNGYISSITSGNVTAALGFTPYNSTNPSGYISTVSSANVTAALGYTPYNNTNPNGYISSVPAQSFSSLTGKPTTIAGYNITDALTTAGAGISVSGNTITNSAPDQVISLTGANGFTATGTYPNFTLTQYVPTSNAVTRTINSTTYTISTTKQAYVNYNITISCTATIGSAASGSVALQYSTNGGTSYTTVGTISNSNQVTLAVTLNSVQVSGLLLSGYIPANALVRLVPTTAGTTTITYLQGVETY